MSLVAEEVRASPKFLHEVSELVNKSDDDFRAYFKGKSLGDVLNHKVLLDLMFNDARKAKDDILEVMPKLRGEQKAKAKAVFDKLYSCMQTIEDKFLILQELEKERINL